MYDERQTMNTVRHTKYCVLMISFGLLLAACRQGPSFSGFVAVDSDAWYREDTACMSIGHPDSLHCGEPRGMTLCVRYTDAYQHRNLHLMAEFLDEAGQVVSSDTICLNMFDGTDHAVGQGFVHYKQTAGLVFDTKRASRLRVFHLMRLNPVRGITDISFSLDSVRRPSSGR